MQTGAVLEHLPLQILYERARVQIGAVLKHFFLRQGLITDWSWPETLALPNPLRNGLIADWSWSEALCLTIPFRKSLITDWSWSEAACLIVEKQLENTSQRRLHCKNHSKSIYQYLITSGQTEAPGRFSILQGPEMSWRGWTPVGGNTSRKLT